jgi:hypothetical protein
MVRTLRTACYAAVTAVLMVLAGASTALARPEPIEPGFLPPATPFPAPPLEVPGPAVDVRSLLIGAALALAVVALGLSLRLWQRAHASHAPLPTP